MQDQYSDEHWAFVVEDDALSLVAIGSLLRDLEICYKRNTTGGDVVAKVEAMARRPDFILLDMDLPDGDPFEILNALKSSEKLASIPVIAIADDPAIGKLPATKRAAFAGFIAKPLPRREFGDLLERILGGERVWKLPV